MKSKKRSVLAVLFAFVACILTSGFPVKAQDAPVSTAIISSWAQSDVKEAFKAGIISDNTYLGDDYTQRISRLQLSRMAVDFIAAEKNTSAQALADGNGLYPQAVKASDNKGNEAVSSTGDTASAQTTPQSVKELPELASGSYKDTKSPYAELANKLNLMVGSEGLFRPDDMLTRAEAAVVLERCMKALSITDANKMPVSFTDTYTIPSWAVEAVKFASGRTDSSGKALMGGEQNVFSPMGTFTVEQSIITFFRMHNSTSIKDVCSGWREAPGYNRVLIKLSFGGDCTFGRDKSFSYNRSFDEMYDLMGPDYFFSGISEFFDDDLTMVNFEGTLTNASSSADKTYVFKGRPEYADILQAGSVDVVTVANNHSMDYLQKGYQDTVANLTPCVAVSGYDMMPILKVKGVNIGIVSNVGWSYDNAQKAFIQNAIQTLRSEGADYIVFFYHWGAEGAYHSNSTQQSIAHCCIDEGADLVIGSHPHVTEETETYKGKQIVYSLGNLVFGGNQNPSDKNCLIFRQTIVFDTDSKAVVSEDDSAIPYLISSVSNRNDYHPVRKN